MALRKEYIAATACIALAVTADMLLAFTKDGDTRPATALCAALVLLNVALVVFWSGRQVAPAHVRERPKNGL